jgi:DNA transformation protein and related proteins
MPASPTFTEYILDLLHPLGEIRAKKMFGEVGIYCNEVFFAMICDDTLYFQADHILLLEFPRNGIPYHGGSLAGMADADLLENHELLLKLARKSYEYKKGKARKKKTLKDSL